MFFAEFAQKIGLFLVIEKKEKITKKAMIVKAILEHSCPNKAMGYRSESTLERIYNGIPDKELGMIIGDYTGFKAKEIEIEYKESIFSEYLISQSMEEEKIRRLCETFADEIPDITPDNYAEKIAKLLRCVYRDAAKANNRTPVFLNVNRDIIAPTINQLLRSLEKLIEWSVSNYGYNYGPPIVDKYEHEPGSVDRVFASLTSDSHSALLAGLEERFNHFIQDYHRLEQFCQRYPDLEQLQTLYRAGSGLKAECFMPAEDAKRNPPYPYSEEVGQYRELLEQFYSEIKSS